MSINFFYGDEDYLIDEELKASKSKLNPEFISMNYTVYDNPQYTDLIGILRTQPMMFGKLMIVINCCKLLAETYDDKQIKEIEEALASNTDTADIFFIAKYPRDENKKPDARKKLYKILSKYNAKEFPVWKTFKSDMFVSFINKEAKKREITVQKDAAEMLFEQIGNNLRQYITELDKLKLLAYPETTVTSDMIKKICITNQDLFNFTDKLIENKKGEALKEFRLLTDKKHPLEILSAVQTMLRRWILIKLKSKTMSAGEIAKLTGQQEFLVKQFQIKLKNTSLKYLTELRKNLTNAEYKIKSGQSINPLSEVENAVIR